MSIINKFKKPAVLATFAVALPISMAALALHASQQFAQNEAANPGITQTQHPTLPGLTKRQHRPKIQLAILLDTSGSMSGLIDQSRQQIWQVVNEFTEAKQDGVKPILEVAVFEYGNDRLSPQSGFIRKVSGLTSELDQVSESLFSLTTNGGQEYCGYVIDTAVEGLNWSDSENDIKAIFIAGNEPFTQGPVPYQEAIAKAKKKGIVVNTIHAGDYNTGLNTGWKDGAVLAGGSFMSINHNHRLAYVNAPQDKRLAELNAELNKTYIPYGSHGHKNANRQAVQDANSSNISGGLLAKRAKSKASGYYRNSTWDLVDAEKEGKVDLNTMEEKDLPAPMRSMDNKQRKAYIAETAKKRHEIKQEILTLSKEREAYVKNEQTKRTKQKVSTMDDALTTAIRKQAAEKNFSLK